MKRTLYVICHLLLKNLPGNLYINLLRGKVVGLYAQGSKKNLQIGRSVNVPNPASLSIGDNVIINAEVYLISSDSTITLGDNCLIAPRCFIQTLNHNFENRYKTISQQGSRSAPITIGNDCWLAYNAVILPGVAISQGCVIAACSVVTKDTEEFSVLAGIPAKKINQRS